VFTREPLDPGKIRIETETCVETVRSWLPFLRMLLRREREIIQSDGINDRSETKQPASVTTA
jgi:hypothetical protein